MRSDWLLRRPSLMLEARSLACFRSMQVLPITKSPVLSPRVSVASVMSLFCISFWTLERIWLGSLLSM